VPHPSLQQLDLPLDETGRVKVDSTMAVENLPGVWAIGDCAAVPNPATGGESPSPPTAQYAIRQGPAVARNVAASLSGGSVKPFEYSGKAAFVNLGRYKAVGMIGGWQFSGFPAWFLARTYHMSRIPTLARKIRAVADWTIGLPFRRDVAELGSIGHPRPLREDEYRHGGSHRPLTDDPG